MRRFAHRRKKKQHEKFVAVTKLTLSSYVLSLILCVFCGLLLFPFVVDKDHLKDIVISFVNSTPRVLAESSTLAMLFFFLEFVNYAGAQVHMNYLLGIFFVGFIFFSPE